MRIYVVLQRSHSLLGDQFEAFTDAEQAIERAEELGFSQIFGKLKAEHLVPGQVHSFLGAAKFDVIVTALDVVEEK